MYEILDHLPPKAQILDLGCRNGSFQLNPGDDRLVVRVDLNKPSTSAEAASFVEADAASFVQADAECLPFKSRTFDAIILNHALEHFVHLKRPLQEVGRVVKTQGAVFVAVPDASTLSDRIYRKLYRNSGGHLNLFDSSTKLEEMLSWYFGLPHVATVPLLTSFTFLNRKNTRNPAVRAQLRFGAVPEPLVALTAAATRIIDRYCGTRTSIYGWALYFGNIKVPITTQPIVNICVRCGEGHEPAGLKANNKVKKRLWIPVYTCPQCGAANILFNDN